MFNSVCVALRRFHSKSVVVVCTVLLWLLSVTAPIAAAGVGTTTTLVSAPSGPTTFGKQVTLIATVFPSFATGKVTFYDGTTVLGEATINSGTAVLSTIMLPAGTRALRALYNGDQHYGLSTSPTLSATINAIPGIGFAGSSGSPFGVGALTQSQAVGDFNGDGKLDIAIASWANVNVAILLGTEPGASSAGVRLEPRGGCTRRW